LLSLLLQLLRKQRSVLDVIVDQWARHGRELPIEADLINSLSSLIEHTDQVYIIVDALDEYPPSTGERARLIALLAILKSFNLANLHILTTSRMELT
jgi:hypothetical protein